MALDELKKLLEQFVDNIDGWVELKDDDMIESSLSDINKEFTKTSYNKSSKPCSCHESCHEAVALIRCINCGAEWEDKERYVGQFIMAKKYMTYSEYFTMKLAEARAIEAFFQRLRERLIEEKKKEKVK